MAGLPEIVPAGQGLRRAAELLRAGAVVAYPTETLYGLAVDACNPRAVRALLQLKGRKEVHPFPCLVTDRPMLARLVREVPARVVLAP